MDIRLPELSLVVLVGCSGSGKSTFARNHFGPHEVLSSDYCRGLVSNDENDQAATGDAFDVLGYVAAKRLKRGLLTVIDATNVQQEARKPLIALARDHDVLPVAIVLNLPDDVCIERNRARPDRTFGPHVVRNQAMQLRRSLRGLEREGFRHVFVLRTADNVANVRVSREPLWNNKRNDSGPFDIIGDVHGCYTELVELLTELGYDTRDPAAIVPPAGRKAVFLGDLVDRGPDSPGVFNLVRGMVVAGTALCVPGNHDIKFMRKLRGKDVKLTHGLAETMLQIARWKDEQRRDAAAFIDSLVSHYVFDGGRLVVAHAGMKERYQGRGSGRVREFALYGETTGETDEYGLPVRHPWAEEYRGHAMVVYGHTPVPEAEWLNNTIDLDTGCVFGGKLTALRYPERELVAVPARKIYAEPSKPFLPADVAAARPAQHEHDDVLVLSDVLGKRVIHTRLAANVTLREQNAAAALEVMSRFAVDPKWLIYLPPTMSPSETTQAPGLLEHPREAFDYFRRNGVARVVCEEKHMGSRAVVIVCRDADAARKRFGVVGDDAGVIYTRTGRRFFDNRAIENALLDRLRSVFSATGLWQRFESDWFCLDCELMPWSAKAQDLLKNQYAAVGTAATAGLSAAVAAIEAAGPRATALLETYRTRLSDAEKFVNAYRRYCWPVTDVNDYKLAPFHLLASEHGVHVDRDHTWHMATFAEVANADPQVFVATEYRTVDLSSSDEEAAATAWWQTLTAAGGEGMVVKPFDFITRGPKGVVQPAIKCRGGEYLRIIYGPDYDMPANLDRLRSRGVSGKRSLASREFALGIEALERFVRREPLRSVHECVFAVLGMESEPIDPRL